MFKLVPTLGWKILGHLSRLNQFEYDQHHKFYVSDSPN